MILLANSTGPGVILGKGRILVAQVHLNNFLHVRVQLAQLLLDLAGLGPDSAVDRAVVVIRQVHQAGETLAEPDRIDNGETQLSRRRKGKQLEKDAVDDG